MANKSFVVQYLIKARDQFSAAAGKTSKSAKKMRKELALTKKTTASLSTKAVVLRSKLRAVVPAMSSLNAQALRLKTTLKGVEKRFEGLAFVGKKLRNAGLAMTAFVTLPAALAARSIKNAARDAEETRSKFRQVFQGMESEAEQVADTFAKSFGLAGTTSRDLLGDAGDLLIGIGLTRKEALGLSLTMNTLASDLASFKNFQGGAAAASSAMLRAMVGEREALKGLGIAITEEMVKRKMSELARAGTLARSKEQLKIMATMALIAEKSQNAVGDFARTQEELANQERITAQRTIELRESFGRVLMPAAILLTKTIRRMADALTDLSPGAKKAILVVGAILAVLGPLLLVIGSIILAIPLLTTAFAAFGAIAVAVLAPVAPAILLIAYAAALVIANWSKVSAFFSGFATGIQSAFGPATVRLIESFKEAAAIIAGLFSGESDAAKSLMEFASLGELVGAIIGGTLDLILRGLSGIGAIIGQVIGAVTTLDFSQFDVAAIKAEFLGAQAEPMLTQTRVDVGVNVGLDPGLKQTGAASVTGPGARRADVGALAQ